MADKRYYWLKLPKDFFKRHDIKIIKAMPNGKDYVLFYLTLLLESLTHDGQLRFSETIPYNEEMLSVITDTNIDVVRSALRILQELHMVEILDDKTIYMTEVDKMLGGESWSAERMRKLREKRNITLPSHSVTCDEEIELEKEIELEIELDKEKDIERDVVVNAREENLSKIVRHYENTLKNFPAPATIPIIESYLDHMDADTICEAMTKAAEAGKATWQYTKGILNNWKQKGIKTVEGVRQEEATFAQKNTRGYETDLQRRKRILDEQIEEDYKNGYRHGIERTCEGDYQLLPGKQDGID